MVAESGITMFLGAEDVWLPSVAIMVYVIYTSTEIVLLWGAVSVIIVGGPTIVPETLLILTVEPDANETPLKINLLVDEPLVGPSEDTLPLVITGVE